MANSVGYVFPVLKLRTDLKITGGNGSSSSPYILGR